MPNVLAVFAHPDDIEFVAAGTLLRLKRQGWDVHYMNVANGCCGSTTSDRAQTAAIRLEESRRSATILGATFYPPICDDLDVFYNRQNLAKVTAVVRSAKPSLLLTHAMSDYMEDHMETCRLVLSAAFARGVPNFASDPETAIYEGDVAIYHAQPHGNRTPDGEICIPKYVVDVDEVMETKLKMLACHESQQAWLKSTQKMNSYVQTMLDLNREVATLTDSGSPRRILYAEGWSPHLHLGYCSKDHDPLKAVTENYPKN